MRIKKSTLYSALAMIALLMLGVGYFTYSRGSSAAAGMQPLKDKLTATSQQVQSAVGGSLKNAADLKANLKPSITNQVKNVVKPATAGVGAQQPAAATNSVASTIQNLIASNPVMVFSKSYCPHCRKAKTALGSYNLASDKYKIIEMDQALSPSEMSQYQDELAKITGGKQLLYCDVSIPCKAVNTC